MFFDVPDKERLGRDLDRFKKIAAVFGVAFLFMLLVSVFYRALFVDFPFALLFEIGLIIWFYLDESISKTKVLYGCAWGVAILYLLALLVLESEVGLSVFSFPMLAPLFSSLVALLGVAHFRRVRSLRYFVLAILLFSVIKIAFF